MYFITWKKFLLCTTVSKDLLRTKAQGARLSTKKLDCSGVRYRKHEDRRKEGFDVDLSTGGEGSFTVDGAWS